MKKLLAFLLLLTITITTLTSCFKKNDESDQPTKIRIGTLSGPTGMGMAKMIADNGMDNYKYSFTVFGDPASAQDAFIAGDVDAICLPTNNAAKLYSKTNGNLYVAAINCLGSLFVVSTFEDNIDDIKDLEGRTIYASVPNSTTGAIINYILEQNGINATVSFEYKGEILNDHNMLSAYMSKGEIDLAILPEPKASATVASNSGRLTVSLNLSSEWDKVSSDTEPLTMGCIVFNKKFADNNKEEVNSFLDEYKASIEYINDSGTFIPSADNVVIAGILPNTGIARKALANLNESFVYIDGSEMQTALEAFYNVIGLELPDDAFYYDR